MKFGVISSWVLILFCLQSYAGSRTVTTTTLDNMWWPGIPGSLQYEIFNATSGDTILFDYGSLGTSPVFNVDNRFYDTELGPNSGGFVVIDALRNKPIGTDKPKITVTGTPGSGGALYLARANTSIIGIEVEDVDGNGIRVTASNVTIDSCVVHGSTNAGINVGNLASNIIIKNSIVYENNQTVGVNVEHAGIYVLDATSVVVDSCYVYSNNGNGVFFDNGADNSILSNSIIGRDEAGNELGNDWNGLFVRGADNTLMNNNIVVNNGKNPPSSGVDRYSLVSGVRLQDTDGSDVVDNYFGTDPAKTSAGNAFEGITLNTNVSNSEILRNVVCYNGFDLAAAAGGGIGLRRVSPSVVVSNCIIKSNFVGAHPDLTEGANNDYGISLEWGTNNIEVGGTTIAEGNVIANSSNNPSVGKGCGVWIVSSGTTDNVLQNNIITGNEGAGVLISGGSSGAASGNIIGTSGNGNTISGNQYGVRVQDSGVNDNTIRYNSFSCNTNGGISLQSSGNDNYGNASVAALPKSILFNSNEKRANYVSGLAPSANASVDIYVSDSNCPADCDSDVNQGFTYVATVTASSTAEPNGLYLWEYDITASPVTQDNVVVLATESGTAGQVNTSEFSVCAVFCNTPENSNIAVNDADICVGETAELSVSPTGLGVGEDYSYTWFRNDLDQDSIVSYLINDNSFSTDIPGTYYVQISSQIDSAVCNDTSDAQIITLNEIPVVTLESDTDTICELKGTQLELRASVEPSLTGNLEWKPNGELNVNSIIIDKAGSYIATFTSNAGCKGSDTLKVVNYCIPPDPEVPNVVTDQSPWKPIGEIQNDQFVSSEFVVYDRWGLKMYSSDEVLPEWKGKKDNGNSCPAGVYYWIWKYKDISGEEYTYNGFLQLLIP